MQKLNELRRQISDRQAERLAIQRKRCSREQVKAILDSWLSPMPRSKAGQRFIAVNRAMDGQSLCTALRSRQCHWAVFQSPGAAPFSLDMGPLLISVLGKAAIEETLSALVNTTCRMVWSRAPRPSAWQPSRLNCCDWKPRKRKSLSSWNRPVKPSCAVPMPGRRSSWRNSTAVSGRNPRGPGLTLGAGSTDGGLPQFWGVSGWHWLNSTRLFSYERYKAGAESRSRKYWSGFIAWFGRVIIHYDPGENNPRLPRPGCCGCDTKSTLATVMLVLLVGLFWLPGGLGKVIRKDGVSPSGGIHLIEAKHFGSP